MRTINSSAININNTPSTTSSFDTPTSRSTTASARSSTPSTSGQTLDPKRFATGKSPRSPVTPSPQARGRFPSAPVSVAVTSNKRSPSIGYHDRKQQQHVLSLTATTTRTTSASSSLGTDSKMPDSRPRPPHLSAAAAKNVGRTPLTPKIAAKGPTLAVRRSTPNRDEPVVTPRSGGRQSRGESTNTTPNGTPIPDKSHDGWDPRASLGHSKRLSISRTDSGNDDSKFFYASDARGAQPQQPPSRPLSTSTKPATFFYANSVTAEEKRTQTPPIKGNLTPATSTPPEPAQSKFFYASGAPEPSLKPGHQSSGPSSASSSNPKRPNTSSSATGPGYAMPPRPLSPIKMQQNPQSILKNSAGPGLNNRHHVASPPPLSASAGFTTKRKVSLESAPRSSRGHSRASSIPTLDSTYSPKFTMSPPLHPSEPSSPPTSPGLTQPVMTMASLLQAAEEFAGDSDDDVDGDGDDDDASHDLQSPTKSTHSSDPVSELVANARRERKVQDLQITNASLEAINRTLERQLRKQTAEIRRFRRLSRAGHIALEPSTTTSRAASAALSEAPISLSELSEDEPTMMSEEEEEDEDEEEEEDEEEDFDSLDDSDMSLEESGSVGESLEPDAEKNTEKKAVRKHRDERRLRLDLTKHRELLVDSQKINQSLKRCLNWTEVLIKEGQKALEYKVNVADVQIGGRVLAPPDDEETPLDEELLESLEAGLEAPTQWEKSSQDRDSGIELQAEIV